MLTICTRGQPRPSGKRPAIRCAVSALLAGAGRLLLRATAPADTPPHGQQRNPRARHNGRLADPASHLHPLARPPARAAPTSRRSNCSPCAAIIPRWASPTSAPSPAAWPTPLPHGRALAWTAPPPDPGQPAGAHRDHGQLHCRNVAGTDHRSGHATGSAIDVSGFVLADGRAITVLGQGTPGRRRSASSARDHTSACRGSGWFWGRITMRLIATTSSGGGGFAFLSVRGRKRR
jgi:hypothetical protein